MLSTFADDFDYQKLDDLVRTSMEGDEVLFMLPLSLSLLQIRDYRIFSHILTSEYAARVGNLHRYDSVSYVCGMVNGCSVYSKDVVLRWTFPCVPDRLSTSHRPVKYKRNQIYLSDGVLLSRFPSVYCRCF